MRHFLLLICLSACSPGDSDQGDDSDSLAGDTSGSGTDTYSGGDGDSDPVDVPSGTNGSVPDEALEAPDFAATNRDGGARDREDLLGHPTVMWFYPAAGTYG